MLLQLEMDPDSRQPGHFGNTSGRLSSGRYHPSHTSDSIIDDHKLKFGGSEIILRKASPRFVYAFTLNLFQVPHCWTCLSPETRISESNVESLQSDSDRDRYSIIVGPW
jgi:hypothetical protein